jgi:hypothetical protein
MGRDAQEMPPCVRDCRFSARRARAVTLTAALITPSGRQVPFRACFSFAEFVFRT